MSFPAFESTPSDQSSCAFLVAAETFANDGGNQVQADDEDHEYDNGRGGVLSECLLWPHGPVVDLDRHRSEVVEQAGVVKRDKGERADHDERGRLSRGPRDGEDHTGRYPGDGT